MMSLQGSLGVDKNLKVNIYIRVANIKNKLVFWLIVKIIIVERMS